MPSHIIAQRCVSFFHNQCRSSDPGFTCRIIDLVPCADPKRNTGLGKSHLDSMVSAVIYPKKHALIAKGFWQHSGEGISSRRAELCHRAFNDGFLVPRSEYGDGSEDAAPASPPTSLKGPRRYRKGIVTSGLEDDVPLESVSSAALAQQRHRNIDECAHFVEERYGRNLDITLAGKAKLAIRKRIAGGLTADVDLDTTAEVVHSTMKIRQVPGFSEDDVYLYPSGMSSIFNTHRIMMACRGRMKSICFGLVFVPTVRNAWELTPHRFPYIDTLKILEKWGPGCQFYGNGSDEDLNDLERRCERGERFLALFCEFPGNPLLKSPNLRRIRGLADRFDFAVIVDETIGNFLNIHVLPDADVVVSSLTKVFSGDSNVMGGR